MLKKAPARSPQRRAKFQSTVRPVEKPLMLLNCSVEMVEVAPIVQRLYGTFFTGLVRSATAKLLKDSGAFDAALSGSGAETGKQARSHVGTGAAVVASTILVVSASLLSVSIGSEMRGSSIDCAFSPAISGRLWILEEGLAMRACRVFDDVVTVGPMVSAIVVAATGAGDLFSDNAAWMAALGCVSRGLSERSHCQLPYPASGSSSKASHHQKMPRRCRSGISRSSISRIAAQPLSVVLLSMSY